MKKILLSVVLITLMIGTYAQSDDVLYIYNKDGSVCTFFCSQIDSISFSSVTPNPQIISWEQTEGSKSGDYFYIKLVVKASISNVTNVKKVGCTIDALKGNFETEEVQDVSGKDFEFTITGKIDKECFSKDNIGEFNLVVYAVGTNENNRAYSSVRTIKLGLKGGVVQMSIILMP